MKLRIKIDVAILIFIAVITGAVYFYAPGFYSCSPALNNILDFFGVIMILKGNLLRMWARGHKKAFSDNSGRLVVTGPYMLTRNPMYGGTFLVGAGFVLVAWPWWILPVFTFVFYIRFKRQIVYEEKVLAKAFGQEYKSYCERTPRLFPSVRQLLIIDWKKTFNWTEALSTKEARGLIIWPIVALTLNCIQEKLIFGYVDLKTAMVVFISACLVFVVGCFVFLRRK